MEIFLTKTLSGTFKPSYDSDYEKVKKLTVGKEYKCKLTQPRNVKFHRKYFALINLVFQNQETYNNIDHLRYDITIASGYYTKGLDMHGNDVKRVKSISFAKMTELEFSELYNSTLDTIQKYFGIDKNDMMTEIEQYF